MNKKIKWNTRNKQELRHAEEYLMDLKYELGDDVQVEKHDNYWIITIKL
jgi:hypothetical protein